MKASTGLRNAVLATGSLKAVLDNGFIDIYAGTVPADADAALGSATLLCVISNNSAGTGIHFAAAASGGVLAKSTTETWSGANIASGTATFARHRLATDSGTLSTTEPRMQLSIGVSGADLNFLDGVYLNSGATKTINAYSVGAPTV